MSTYTEYRLFRYETVATFDLQVVQIWDSIIASTEKLAKGYWGCDTTFALHQMARLLHRGWKCDGNTVVTIEANKTHAEYATAQDVLWNLSNSFRVCLGDEDTAAAWDDIIKGHAQYILAEGENDAGSLVLLVEPGILTAMLRLIGCGAINGYKQTKVGGKVYTEVAYPQGIPNLTSLPSGWVQATSSNRPSVPRHRLFEEHKIIRFDDYDICSAQKYSPELEQFLDFLKKATKPFEPNWSFTNHPRYQSRLSRLFTLLTCGWSINYAVEASDVASVLIKIGSNRKEVWSSHVSNTLGIFISGFRYLESGSEDADSNLVVNCKAPYQRTIQNSSQLDPSHSLSTSDLLNPPEIFLLVEKKTIEHLVKDYKGGSLILLASFDEGSTWKRADAYKNFFEFYGSGYA